MDSTTPDSVDGAELTHARDVMTTSIISVGPDVPVREIATLLLDKRISAVPVVKLGIVSEGDLVGRGERERLTRRGRARGVPAVVPGFARDAQPHRGHV